MSKNNTFLSVLIFLIFLTSILGCRGLLRRPTNYFEKNNIQAAAAAIKNKIGMPFKIFKVEIEKGKFTMQIQSPQNADNLDEYQYSGGVVAGPHPVHTDTFYDFRKYVFDFDDKDFAAIPPMIIEALAKSQIENAEISHLTLSRGVGSGDDSPIRGGGQLFDVRWFIAIRGARANTTAVADEQGKLQGVDLSKSSGAKNYDVLQEDELKKAIESLKKSVGDEKKIYKISITHEALGTEILNSQNKLDGYRFNINGFNRAGSGELFIPPTNETFSINDVNLSDAPTLIQKAVERLNLKNGMLNNVKIERTNLFESEHKFRVIWKILVKGDSGEGYVEFNAKGKEIDARKLNDSGTTYEDIR